MIIRDLLGAGFINGATCLVERRSWKSEGAQLADLATRKRTFAIGLHLNLTEQLDTNSMPAISLARLAVDRSLTLVGDLRTRFFQQWDAFVQVMGEHPQFIDGHRHVHLLPAARAALFQLIDDVGFCGWVRQCRTSSQRAGVKRLILDRLSAVLQGDALARGVPLNPGFGGLRAFREREDVLSLWSRDLAAMSKGGVLMVHPGSDAPGDPIGKCRMQEARLLPLLPRMVREAGLTLQWDARSQW
ncbi:MAG: ChbG/HpnK family deacetylase [Proteobacteria bacterium]|nr:ChbG/HpnK family deacetylase [Pseudomonadota bacterium]